MPWPWLLISEQIWIRSFKWGTVRSCRSRGCKNIRGQSWRPIRNCQLSQIRDWCARGRCRIFSTSNFDLWYFCSLLTYKSVQYLIWKIWFISVWRLKARAMAWLLTWFMFAQSTLISYHTEAFVKTEVGCTVIQISTLDK